MRRFDRAGGQPPKASRDGSRGMSEQVLSRRALPRIAMTATVAMLCLLWVPGARGATLEEIIVLCRSGVSPDIVIRSLRSDPSLPTVGPEELGRLRKAGVPGAVIRFLRSRSRHAGAAADTPRPSARAERDIARRQEANRLRQEAARLRTEATKLARAARTAEVRRKGLRSQVKNALDSAFSALRRGRNWLAISRFSQFLGSGLVPPNSYAFLEGSFGLARAYLGADMLYAAAEQLVIVIRRGVHTPRFDAAVLALAKVLDKIDFVHPVVALLAEFDKDVANRPQAWKDAYHFLLGAFYERYDDTTRALRYFTKVSARSPRYPVARYHMGVLETARKRPRTGVRLFRAARRAARTQGNQAVLELATLALARLAFEVGSYGAALHYYREIPRRSRHFSRAQYELAWTYVMSERYRLALGTIHGLHAPFFRDRYLPDLLILEAAVYLNLCRTRAANVSLNRFRRQVGPALESIRHLIDSNPTPAALRAAAMRTAAGLRSPLPPLGLRAVLGDLRIYHVHRSWRRVRKEMALARRALTGVAKRQILSSLRRRQRALGTRLGLEIRRRLRDVLVQLDGLKVKADEIGLEVELAEKTALEARRRALASGRSTNRKRGRRGSDRLRPEQIAWPAQREYWLDEIGSFRSRLRSACRVPLRTPRGAAGGHR